MTFNNVDMPEPSVYIIREGFVTYKGDEFRFWYEKDYRDGSTAYEFMDGEPNDDFDFAEFDERLAKYCDEVYDRTQFYHRQWKLIYQGAA